MIKDLIPPAARRWVYAVLAVLNAVQLTFAVLPVETWGRVLSLAALLGFSLATANTTPATPTNEGAQP